jgi:uncharacterized LabA/DUF88 family protein
MMRTSIYVDGFNLYFGGLKNTPYKWLDIKALCSRILKPENDIRQIKYFTAHVSPTPSDPVKHLDQQIYLRALRRATPEIEIITGQFTTHKVRKRLVNPPPGGPVHAEVFHTTEKGSDVNLAVHLVNDAWLNAYGCAVLISGDSDLAESINLVRAHHPKKVIGVFAPGKRGMSQKLVIASTFIRYISPTALADSQFPAHIPGTTIFKPKDW